MVGSSLKSGSFRRGGAVASPEEHPQEVRARAVAAKPARAKIWMSCFIVTVFRLRWRNPRVELPSSQGKNQARDHKSTVPGLMEMISLLTGDHHGRWRDWGRSVLVRGA